MTGDDGCERSREQQFAGLEHLMAIAREQAEGRGAEEAARTARRYPETKPLGLCPDQGALLDAEASGYRAGRHRR